MAQQLSRHAAKGLLWAHLLLLVTNGRSVANDGSRADLADI